MINGALQIIGDVPGKHLDPLLLAQSQSNDSLGFMMIAYATQSANADTPLSRFYDLFFLRGSHICECARMNRDLRFQLHLDVALQTFKRAGREDSTRVFLFAATDEVLTRFRSTFFYEPCLKVQAQGLSNKHMQRLVSTTGCQRGIIECNEFIDVLPSLDLRDVASPEDLSQYRPPFKHGRILLYDLEKNKELVEVRYASHPFRSTAPSYGPSMNPGQSLMRSHHASPGKSADGLVSAVDEKEAEEFTQFITQILNSAPPTISPEGDTSGAASSHSANNDPQLSIDQESEHSNSFVITYREPEQVSLSSSIPRPSPPTHGRAHRPPRKPRNDPAREDTSENESATSLPESSEYLRLFERLFRSFRQRVFDSFGDKCDSVIADAESKVRFLTPEFDLHSLNESTAIIVLDLIENIAAKASFLKRPRLRQAALTLVADLYNKQYELLEKHGVIDKVEQFYYRLKK